MFELRVSGDNRQVESVASLVEQLMVEQYSPLVLERQWPEYFDLFRKGPGETYRAELNGCLRSKFDTLTANVSDESYLVMRALERLRDLDEVLLSRAYELVIESPQHVASKLVPHGLKEGLSILRDLKIGLQPDLQYMQMEDSGRPECAKRLGVVFERALVSLVQRTGVPKAHGRAEKYSYDYLGDKIEVPLPWLAIEFARCIVENEQKLPTKAEVRARLIAAYPQLGKKKDSDWSDVYRKAGLSGLDSAMPWEVINNKKAKSREAKSKLGQP